MRKKRLKSENRRRLGGARRVSRNSSVFSFRPALLVVPKFSPLPALVSAPFLPLVPDVGELKRPVRRPQGDDWRGRGQEAGQVGENCGIRRRRRFLRERRRSRSRGSRRRSHRLRSSSWSCSSSSSSSGEGAPGALHAVGPRSRAALVGLALWVRETAMREENGGEQALSLSLSGKEQGSTSETSAATRRAFCSKKLSIFSVSLALTLFSRSLSRSL